MSDLTIGGIPNPLSGSALATSAISGLQGLLQTDNTSLPGATSGGAAAGWGPAATAQISKQGQLFSQLQQLQSSDPDKVKQLLTDAANKLNTAAQSATGADQQFLSNLAAKFTKAAGGDLSALEPPHRSASSAVGAAYQQGAQTTLDGSSLTALAQSATSNPAGQAVPSQSGQAQSGASGGHHHHHHGGGGHSKLSATTQQTLQSVFQGLNSALGGSTTTGDDASATGSVPAAA